MQITPEQIAEIRERIDIIKVVEASVRLEKRGRRWVGLCPFHSEKTPSFGVSAEKQLYHCFGCGAGGDVFDFVMQLEGLDFPAAVRRLAAMAGVQLPERARSPAEARRAEERKRLLSVNEAAQRIFSQALSREPTAQRYLHEDRGLTDETIARFGLGWAPASWDHLSSALSARGASLEDAQALGLLGFSDKSQRRYDRLRGRVVFPIGLPTGGIAGFGGRRADWVDADAPKYLNSPESPIYKKSSLLYGLDLAKGDLRRKHRALLVEGYLDVIALAQAGLSEAVAGCGTALTAEHARLLKRYVREVFTLYDGDRAGREATRKAALLLLQAGIAVRVVSFPSGEDPDSFVRSQGAEAMNALIEAAPSALDFFLAEARADFGGGGVAGAIRSVQAVKPLILAISDPLERDVAIEAAAQQLGLDARSFARHLRTERGGPSRGAAAGGARSGQNPQTPPFGPPAGQAGAGGAGSQGRSTIRPKPISAVEGALLALMLNDPSQVLNALQSWSDEAWDARDVLSTSPPLVQDAFKMIEAEALNAAALSDRLLALGHPGAEVDRLRTVFMSELSENNPVEGCVRELVHAHTRRRLKALMRQVQTETDADRSEALLLEVNRVNALKRRATQLGVIDGGQKTDDEDCDEDHLRRAGGLRGQGARSGERGGPQGHHAGQAAGEEAPGRQDERDRSCGRRQEEARPGEEEGRARHEEEEGGRGEEARGRGQAKEGRGEEARERGGRAEEEGRRRGEEEAGRRPKEA